MEKEKLEHFLGQGFTQRRIANKLGISQATVRYWVTKHGLSKGNVPCKYCGNSLTGRKLSVCSDCRNKKYTLRWDRLRKKAVEYLGGKCSICGYYKYIGALEFHHLNPSEKRWTWSDMKKHTWNDILSELDKCVLLCSNCHREKEADLR